MIQEFSGEENLQRSRCAEFCVTTQGFTEGQFGSQACVTSNRVW
jgi:hypothetical protein